MSELHSEDLNDPFVNGKGLLKVSDRHSLYWEDWGSPDGKVIFHLHGGPGSSFSDTHKSLYNPETDRVIFHNQRGSGKSTPFAEIAENTSQNLVGDIEKLREYFGIEKLTITGGSWGSTLALLYTIAYPERVERLVIWSLFLARQFEIDFVNEGYPKYYFPEAWNRFIALVPETERHNGNTIMQYYAGKIHSNEEGADKYANEWTLWETTLMSIAYDSTRIEKEVFEDPDTLAIAKLETHYFLNHCFIPENYLLDNVHKIRNIPCSLVHGRFDMCTPPVSAVYLKEVYGENLSLEWVNSGHLTSEPEMFSALKKTMSGIVG